MTAIQEPEQTTGEGEKVFPHSPFLPYDSSVMLYDADFFNPYGTYAKAFEYTGWQDETQSWKTTAYLHGHLNPSPTVWLKGPDALKFLSSVCVNSFNKFQIGTSRHAIMCDENGKVACHGMLLRLAEDEFITYWLSPYLPYQLSKQMDLDLTVEDRTGKVFLYQIGGPKSLEILEAVCKENLHDVKFLRHRETSVNGVDVRVLRLGMAATLSYELHGPAEHAQAVYKAIREAGEEYGLRQLGIRAYMCNHTEGGFGQAFYHFPLAWVVDEEFQQLMEAFGMPRVEVNQHGSVGDDLQRRFKSPYDLGWGHMINFNHDFVGRAALEKEVAAGPNTMVTLVWNADDIADVLRSQFGPGEPHTLMDLPNHIMYDVGDQAHRQSIWADKVFSVDGQDIGTSSGRCYTNWSKDMLSLATVPPTYASEGTEVTVLWGEAGTHQKHIRATVARFPYLIDPVRNENYDVSTIPSRYPAHQS
jgi:glycine cleavage system aminomethyltransferase T